MKRFILAALVILTAGAFTLPMLGSAQTPATYSGNCWFPAGFQPGDSIVITWQRGGLTPAPTPSTAAPLPPLNQFGLTPPMAFAATFTEAALPAKILFPVPAAPAVPGGQALWNVPIDALPVHANSATWLTTIGAAAPIHPDFGAASYGAGVPYNVVPGTQKLQPVTIGAYASDSDLNAAGYPIPDGAFLEAPTDNHLIVVDKDNWIAWEFYGFALAANQYSAKQVTKWDLKIDAKRTAGLTSADAAGMSILAGLVKYDEVNSGAVAHAFRFTVKPTDHAFVPPASHYSAVANPAAPPMGARWRLKSTVDITVLPGTTTATTPRVRAFLACAQKYGLIVSDNGTTGYVQGTPDARWDDSEMGALKKFTLAMGEFVDTGFVPVTSVP